MTKLEIANYARYGWLELLAFTFVMEMFFDPDFFEKLLLGVLG